MPSSQKSIYGNSVKDNSIHMNTDIIHPSPGTFDSASGKLTGSTPAKPPRSPKNVRKPILNFGLLENAECNVQQKSSHGSPSHNIREAVDVLLQTSPSVSPASTSPRNSCNNFGTKSASDNSFEGYNALNSELQALPLPSPPQFIVDEDGMSEPLPSPPFSVTNEKSPSSNPADNGQYDVLNLNQCGSGTEGKVSTTVQQTSLGDNQQVYNIIAPTAAHSGGQSPAADKMIKPPSLPELNLQVPPPRVATYEEVVFNDTDNSDQTKPSNYEEPVFKITDKCSHSTSNSNTDSPENGIYSSADGFPDGSVKDTKSQMDFSSTVTFDNMTKKDSSVRRSKSFDIYDTVLDAGTNIECKLFCAVTTM